MIRLYRAIGGRKHTLIGEGESLTEAVKDAYNNDEITTYDELYREDLNEQIDALVDYVRTAHQDYVIENDEL